jgi:hypothetical protein
LSLRRQREGRLERLGLQTGGRQEQQGYPYQTKCVTNVVRYVR